MPAKFEFLLCRRKINIFLKAFQPRLYHNNIRIMEYVNLGYTDAKVPTLGLGTWQAPPDVIENVVYKALQMGYRLIDTAFNYNNEEAIGKAISKWLIVDNGCREDLFITTKLPHIGNRAADVKKFLDIQLGRLKLSYVDLYLIHVPFGFVCNEASHTPAVNEDGFYCLDMDTDHISTWKAMEECQRDGLTANIGLSNFNEKQIKRIMEYADIPPQVLQVELHAYFQQKPLQEFCEKNNIVLMAYAPLGSPGAKEHFVNKYNYKPADFPDVLGHPVLKEIASAYGRSPAQVLLHFLVRQNMIVIPKSTSEHRLKENINIYDFELHEQDIARLKALDRGEKGRIFNFLFWKGVERHPEYPFPQIIDLMEQIK